MGTDSDIGALPGWRVVAASVPGQAHELAGARSQDAHGVGLRHDALFVAVADGAGSACHADVGAHTAVESALASLLVQFDRHPPVDEIGWTECLSQALADARSAIEQVARSRELDARQFAATLTCTACDGEWLAAAQVGDGLIVARIDGGLQAVIAPQRGEYVNETVFLTEPDALHRASYFAQRTRVHALAVTTDGLLRLATEFPDCLPYAPFFEPLFAFAAESVSDTSAANAELEGFLASERVAARTDDDRTLVLAVR
jgi:hypothetical protein